MKCLFIFSICIAAGCSSGGPVLVPVSGQVTVDGEPVTSGRIEFFPESGRPSLGNINGEGRYELRTFKPGDGAELGKYRVVITSLVIPDSGPVYNSFEDEMNGVVANPDASKRKSKSPRVTWLVPQKYSKRDSSDLDVEVSGEVEDMDFHL